MEGEQYMSHSFEINSMYDFEDSARMNADVDLV